MKKKVLGVILCRSNSSRLKNKLKIKLYNTNIFTYFFKRLSYCKNIDEIIISTTKNKNDDYFQTFAEKNNLHIYRGSQNNVFERVKNSIKYLDNKFDIVIRCNADNPLIMPTIIDEDLNLFSKCDYDFFTPFYNNQIPFGFSFSIFKTKTLLNISETKLTNKQKEHIDNYFIDNSKKYKILKRYNRKYFCPNLFLTLDTKFDLKRIKYFVNKIKNIQLKKQPEKIIKIFQLMKSIY